MPRQRTHHSRNTYVFPEDFSQRLVRLKEESGLTWAEMSCRLGVHPHTHQAVDGRGAARPILPAGGTFLQIKLTTRKRPLA